MSRVLETVLTGRNLLSPVLSEAGRDVAAFNSTVASANEKAATSATASARTQQAAATTTAGASEKAAGASTAGSARQAAAAEKIAASNVKASTSATASANTQSRSYAKAAESATLSARAQESANRSLSAANGLLGTSLTPLTAGLGAVGLALGYSVYRGMEFDAAMSQVQAASQASAGDMDRLRDAAIEQGAKTKYSSEEAAQGITEMAKAGVSTADVLNGGLAGALNLAAAGGIDVAEAAETGATALSVFQLKGSEMSHVADLLAAGAGKAQGSVQDMSAALNQSALVAAQTGLSIEDTSGALAMFASNGLIGSDAGTSFKTMLQALTPNSVAASKAMDAIGFSAYDAQGNFVGMESVAAQLREGLSGLTEEQRNTTLETIFGSDAVRAASVLYKEGSAGVAEWASSVDDAGYAQRQAAQNADNLKGDLEKLGGAADSVFTSIGGLAQGPLREIVQVLTFLVDTGGDVVGFFTSLPGPVQLAVAAFAGFTLLRGPLDDFLGSVVGNFTKAQIKVGEAGGAMTLAKGALTGLLTTATPFLAVAAISFGISEIIKFTQAGDEARDSVTSLERAIEEADGNAPRFDNISTGIDDFKAKIEDLTPTVESWSKENRSWFEKAFIPVTSGAQDARESLTVYQDKLAELEDAQERYGLNVEALGDKYHITRDQVVDFADAHAINLTGALDTTQWAFTRLVSSTGEFSTVVGALPGAIVSPYESLGLYAQGLGLSEDATKDLIDRSNELGESLAAFVDPLGTYTGLLQQKAQAEADAANATAEKTGAASKSWEDFKDNVHVTFDEYMADLQAQVDAQTNWQTNMLLLAGRVSSGTLAELSRMGPEGAPLVADLVNRSDAELDRFDDITAARSKEATDAWGEQLTLAAPVLAAVGVSAGQGVVAGLVAQLQAGTTTVGQIAAQYGLTLAGGINPILTSLGKAKITYTGTSILRNGREVANADGNLYEDHQAEIAPGGAWRVWAEPETGGEAYIPLSPAKRDRSMGIWRETGKRLGAPEAQHFAAGGFFSAADVPRPSSTAPYQAPISTAGDAAMDAMYQETTKWVQETGPSGSALSWAKSQVGKPYIWGGVGPAGYDCSGFMSAITNVLRGKSPYSRVGATATFPWAGFAPGDGIFTVGSTPNAGGGIGHMAGTLMGVNVESRGGQGVVVGGSARGAHNSLFGTRAHLAMYTGGVIAEPVIGMGMASGRSYSFGERGPETVLPGAPASMPGYGSVAGSASGGGKQVVIHSTVTFAGPVYGEDAMRRIATDVVTSRDAQLARDTRSAL